MYYQVVTEAKRRGEPRPLEERYAEVGGLRLRYLVGGPGAGPPLVLVHGLGGSVTAARCRLRESVGPASPTCSSVEG